MGRVQPCAAKCPRSWSLRTAGRPEARRNLPQPRPATPQPMRTESRVPSASLAEGDRRTPDTQRHVSIWNSCQAHKQPSSAGGVLRSSGGRGRGALSHHRNPGCCRSAPRQQLKRSASPSAVEQSYTVLRGQQASCEPARLGLLVTTQSSAHLTPDCFAPLRFQKRPLRAQDAHGW